MQTLLNEKDSFLQVEEEFLEKEEADELLKYVLGLPLIQYPKGKLFGKEITFHRSIGFFTNSDKGYKFSGQTIKTGNLCDVLQQLIDKVNAKLNIQSNGILVNVYNSGLDYISAHSDNEKELGVNPTVAAITLNLPHGQSRTFRIRDKTTKKIVLDVLTTHGQLLVMGGKFQANYTHEIPIEKNKDGIRVSLTFRTHV